LERLLTVTLFGVLTATSLSHAQSPPAPPAAPTSSRPPRPRRAVPPALPGVLRLPRRLPVPGHRGRSVACGPPGRFWVSAEALLWWTRNAPLPVLATTGPPSSLGILGQGGRPLFGPTNADFNDRWGWRVNAGFWLDDCRTKGSRPATSTCRRSPTPSASRRRARR